MVANLLASGSIGEFHGAMGDIVRNPFKTKFMRINYDAVVSGYDRMHRNFIYPSGARCIGNALAVAFWRGFDDISQNWDAHSRQTPVYAAWRAGRDIKSAIEKKASTTDTCPTTRKESPMTTQNIEDAAVFVLSSSNEPECVMFKFAEAYAAASEHEYLDAFDADGQPIGRRKSVDGRWQANF